MNNRDNFSESLEKIFGVKILKFYDADPGWKKFGSGMEKIRIRDEKKSRIRDKHPGSATPHVTVCANSIYYLYFYAGRPVTVGM